MTVTGRSARRRGGQPRWLRSVSAIATGLLMAVAVGTPMAFADSSPTPDPLAILATDAASPAATGGATAEPTAAPPATTAATISPATQAVSGEVGTELAPSSAFTESGFTGTVIYAISPDLPVGVVFATSTGILSGTPGAALPATEFTITASDGTASAAATITLEVTAAARQGLAPRSQSLVGRVDTPITDSAEITASGFAAAPTFSITPALPDGLVLSATTGVVSGTPLVAQVATEHTITGRAGAESATATITIATSPLVLPQTESIDAIVGDAITPTVVETRGFPDPVTFTIDPTGPQLVDGLVLDPDTGSISGTPTVAQALTYSTLVSTDGTFTVRTTIAVKADCPTVVADGPACVIPDPQAPAMALMDVGIAGFTDPHTPAINPTQAQADSCAGCHRTHSSQQTTYLSSSTLTSTQLCYTCHDGTGATSNVKSQYTSATTPNSGANIYMHDPTSVSATQPFFSDDDGLSIPAAQFAAPSTLRQAACVDCHNPHNATNAPSVRAGANALDPWAGPSVDSKPFLAGGPIAGASGVQRLTATAAPTKLVGGADGRITYEYELCYKCHSSYTAGGTDVAAQFVPSNKSFHPVEAVGTNTSAVMNTNLRFGTVYNATNGNNFTTGQTVACTHCHASGSGTRDVHVTSAPTAFQEGLLIGNYRRTTALVDYNANDYTLCFACHDARGITANTNSNFSEHDKHVVGERLPCATCHYELHGINTPQGNASGKALVSFPPNANRVVTFTWTSPGNGSCSVTGNNNGCHGQKSY